MPLEIQKAYRKGIADTMKVVEKVLKESNNADLIEYIKEELEKPK